MPLVHQVKESIAIYGANNEEELNTSDNDCTLILSDKFDTSQVEYMDYMFANCTSLKSLDLSSIDTANVTYMGGMFYNCSSLTSLDISSF